MRRSNFLRDARGTARADEAPPDAEAADAPAEPPAEEKVDAMTYVFGKPGELQGDMARMGTSPRRLALFGLLGLFIALAGDLFRLTSTLLRIAPGGVQDAARRARLDTYYPIGDFKRYIDDEYGFEVRYPEMWLADQAIYVSRMQARTGAGAVDAEALLRSRKQRGPPLWRASAARRRQVREFERVPVAGDGGSEAAEPGHADGVRPEASGHGRGAAGVRQEDDSIGRDGARGRELRVRVLSPAAAAPRRRRGAHPPQPRCGVGARRRRALPSRSRCCAARRPARPEARLPPGRGELSGVWFLLAAFIVASTTPPAKTSGKRRVRLGSRRALLPSRLRRHHWNASGRV